MNKLDRMLLGVFGIIIGLFSPIISGAQTLNHERTVAFSKEINKDNISQQKNPDITLDVKNILLEKALKLIANQAEAGLYYKAELLPDKRISIHVESLPLNKLLHRVLKDSSLEAITNGRNIILKRKKEEQQNSQISVQQKNVVGVVKDAETNEVLPGVNILLKGTSTGASTNASGKYSITVNSLQDTLVFSYIGYQKKTVPIKSRTSINIALKPQVIAGEQMVVVGYGQQQRSNLTSSVGTVSGDEITQAPTATVGNALSGRVPGLQTIQRSGQPGDDAPEIYIRGVASLSEGRSHPIYVLDGVIQRGARSIMQLDPDNIKSISVLKGPSATSIYGVEGANGAIVVKTKRGKKGPAKISVRMSGGFQEPYKTPNFVDSYTFVRAHNEAELNDGVDPSQVRYPPKVINAFKKGKDPLIYPNLDFVDIFTKPRAFQARTNINVSGGTDDVRYYVAAGYLKQDGFFKTFKTDYDFNPTFDRYNFRSNLDINVTPSTKVSLTSGGRFGSRVKIRGVGQGAKKWWKLYWASPLGGAGIDDQGRVIDSGNRYIPGPKKNPIKDVYGNGYNEYNKTTLNLDLSATQQLDALFEGLSFQLKGAYNIYYTRNIYRSGNVPVVTPAYRTDLDASATGDSTIVFQKQGTFNPLGYNEGSNRDRDWYIEGRLKYDRNFGPHHVKGLLLYNQRRNFYPDSYTGIPRSLESTVGRINYNYDDRYLAQFSVGYNGSENFAPGRRFGFFPSASVGWTVTNEPYMPDIPFLDYLKFRASYGIVGNDRGIGRFLYLPDQYNASAGGYNLGISVPNDVPGASEGALGNQKVTWERSEKEDYGVDAKLFDNKLNLGFTYYHEYRSRILTRLNTVPDYVAANLPAVNIGEVENQGYEIEAGWNQNIGDFFYSIKANMAYSKNIIKFQDEVHRDEPYLRHTGKPVGQNFGYVVDRWYTKDDFKPSAPKNIVNRFPPEPGYPKYKDLNADGVINTKDQRAIGYPEYPEYTFGANFNFRFKNVDLSMQWAGATNVSRALHVSPFATPFGGAGQFGMMQYMWDNRWTPERGQDATYPKLTLKNRGPVATNSTISLRDASYLRLKNIQVGYNFGSSLLQNVGFKRMRIYLSGYNLLTFTKMEILDPEQSADAQQVRYPVMKVYNMGIKLDF